MIFNFKYRNYAKALHKALCDDAFYITMEGSIKSEDSPREAMLRYMEFSMIEAEKSGELYFPENHDHGVIVPFLVGFKSRDYATFFIFCFGVIPPIPILGRSLL